MKDLSCKLFGLEFKNPLWTASGTFGIAKEFTPFLNLDDIGAIVTKTITYQPRLGNNGQRIVETPCGILNSIGLENPGVKKFIVKEVPLLQRLNTKVIISVAATNVADLANCLELLQNFSDFPAAFELNLSCPNIEHTSTKKMLIAQSQKQIKLFIETAKKSTNKPIIAKLTPNVTDISKYAKAAEQAGADALSLVNTYIGMSIDVNNFSPIFKNIYGGLSGPCIKPLALYAIWRTSQAVQIPIIGIGGIMQGIDVAEFMLAGASAVQIGSANLIDPQSYSKILTGFKNYLQMKKISNYQQLIGKLNKIKI